MVWHKAIGMEDHAIPQVGFMDDFQESVIVGFIAVDRAVFQTTVHHMVKGAWIVDPEWSCHIKRDSRFILSNGEGPE